MLFDTQRSDEFVELADAFLEELRQGAEPSIDAYVSAHPQYSDEIRHYFPLLSLMRSGADETSCVANAESRPDPSFRQRLIGDLPRDFGRYRLVSLLGQGAMGAVYLAEDSVLHRQVALKIPVLPDGRKDVAQRFHREARAMATVDHPNVCPIYDMGEVEGQPYLTMAYIPGTVLKDRIGMAPWRSIDVAHLVCGVADGLQAAHDAGVIHRDLKPANIMLNADNQPVIMDFGLARRDRFDESTLTDDQELLGSPAYMSPEQIESSRVGPTSDIYSLGVVTYELLCGRRPFVGARLEVLRSIGRTEPTPPSQLRPDVASELEAICLKAMSRDESERFTTASELRDSLIRYLESETGKEPETRKRPTIEKSDMSVPQPRTSLRLAGVTLVLLAVVTLLWIAFRPR